MRDIQVKMKVPQVASNYLYVSGLEAQQENHNYN